MPDKIEACIASLEATGDYRVVRRFARKDSYAPGGEKPAGLKIACVLDTETTGLDVNNSKLIEVGFVLAEFDPVTGSIYDVIDRYSGLDDPGEPLSDEITEITGLTSEMLAGEHFDMARIQSAFDRADLMLAQNAAFDRSFLERRFPSLQSKWWACTQREGPWRNMHTGSSKLEYLSYAVGRCFYDAHRALNDAEVLLYLLTCPAHDERPILAHILESSRKRSWRLWATGAPIEVKDKLKQRGYKWSDGSTAELPIKAWYRDNLVDDLGAELEWLQANIYPLGGNVSLDQMTGRERYSARYSERTVVPIGMGN